MDSYDGGYTFYEGQQVYWDKNNDGSINIFPQGQPFDRKGHSHDHIVLEGADVTYMRGSYVITGGRVTYKRVNGRVEIDNRGFRF